MSGCLIGPKNLGQKCEIFWNPFGQFVTVCDCLGTLGHDLCNNYVLVCRRPEMAMELGSTKWTRCLVSGLPTDSPLLYFGTIKNSPGFV